LHADAFRDVERLIALVTNLQDQGVSKLADALRRGDDDVAQDDLLRARDDLAAATRRRDGLKLAVNRQRAAVIAACRDQQLEWGSILEPEHADALTRYRAALNELYEAQTGVEQVMDARAMLDDPREERRKHGRFGNRGGVGVGGKRTRWAGPAQ
jgi:hypothetical protein